MKIGIHLGNNGTSASADSIATLAVRAAALGFDSVWVSDHIASALIAPAARRGYRCA